MAQGMISSAQGLSELRDSPEPDRPLGGEDQETHRMITILQAVVFRRDLFAQPIWLLGRQGLRK